MSYITFTRKYRPSSFLELKGQDVLVKVLNYSIKNNRISQAYLLTGIRGVGKTTSARIIAKTINCFQPLIQDECVVPCNSCINCQSVLSEQHPDIVEMDAASRTSVVDVRSIIQSSEYKPLIGKYKVFIIDEVHMLSKSAFNALLKLIEEPPAHVIFIFATTEVQKIPLTVLSRCQRYDLKRFSANEVLELLKKIATHESIDCDLDALNVIAARSEGSARDATSMLDQINHLALQEGGKITASMVYKMLGATDVETIINLFTHIISGSAKEAIELVNDIYVYSPNLVSVVESLCSVVGYLSKLEVLKLKGEASGFRNISEQDLLYQPFYAKILSIQSINLSQLSILWQIFTKAISEIKSAYNPLIVLEMVVIKAIYFQSLPEVSISADGNYDGDDNARSKSNINDKYNTPVAERKSQRTTGMEMDALKEGSNRGDKMFCNLEDFSNFLLYVRNKSELQIYYLLVNDVEIKKFSDNILEFEGKGIDHKIRDMIQKLLYDWSGINWNIVFNQKFSIVSFKENLMQKFKNSQEWQIMSANFVKLNIIDILLKVKV